VAIIIPANSAAVTAFDVDNSCRFNDDDSAYMHKTPSAGNVDRWTFSAWVKRGSVSTAVALIGSSPTANNNFETIGFAAAGDIDWEHYEYTSSSYKGRLKTNRLFRDPSAWYHIVAVWDSANATAGNRMRLYVNGVEETSLQSETQPSSGQDSLINSGNPQQVGASGGASQFFDGYMAEVYFIDGTVYGPTDFGEFDEDSPTIWKPIDASGLTFGTNGFYLDFKASDNLGNDANGGTDLTEVNLAAADQSIDTPTNNFCVMNSLDNYYPGDTLSEGNTNVVTGSSAYTFLTSTIGVSAGKWYYEAKIVDEGTHANVGIATKPPYTTNIYPGFEPNDYFYKSTDGNSYTSDAGSSYGNTYTTNDIIGVYIDLDNSKLYFAKNGTVQNSGTGISITTPAAASIDFSSESGIPGSGFYFPAVGDYSGSDTSTFALNFGNGQFAGTAVSSGNADANGYGNFEYNPSSGTFDGSSKNFLAICTKNLGSDGG